MVQFDVAIIGGGPAGLFAALAIHSVGASVVVVADERPANTDNRTTALLDGSVRALERMNVWQRCAHHGEALKVMRLIDDTGRLFRAPTLTCDAQEIGLETFGYNIENRLLNEALLARLAETDVNLIYGRAQSVDLKNGYAEIALDGKSLTARLVVGADGRNSLVRQAAGVDLNSEAYPQVTITANLSVEKPHNNISTEFHTIDGPFTLVPLPGNRVSIVCSVKPEKAEALYALDDAAFSLEIEKKAHSILGKMQASGPRGKFPLSRATPERFAGEGFALVGEAAHIVPPIGAQGLNLGLRDGAALAECFENARQRRIDFGCEAALKPYDAARRRDILSRTITVDVFNKSLFSSFFPLHAMRGAGIALMNHVPFIRQRFMREGLQPSGATPRMMRA